jgi:23S rRNA (guanosine2251-2'-O)-methyltransferase
VIIYGLHPCRAALLNPERKIEKVFVTNKSLLGELPNIGKIPVEVLDKSNLEKLLPPQSVHQGVALRVQPLTHFDLSFLSEFKDDNQIVVVLDQVTDPHNVGAILRSAAAFGAKALIQTDRNAPKETGVMAKSASGALDQVPLCAVSNLARALEELKDLGFWLVGFAEGGKEPLHAINLKGKIALVMGAEGDGLRSLTRSLCDFQVYLPTTASFSTLNVSNAAAVALYECFRQQSGK